MDTKLKMKWIRALLGGKYRQGKGVLRAEDNRFCCLGVLLNELNPKGWDKKPVAVDTLIHGKSTSKCAYYFDNEAHGLPQNILDRLGIGRSQVGELISMNDAGKRFSTIAQYIKAEL